MGRHACCCNLDMLLQKMCEKPKVHVWVRRWIFKPLVTPPSSSVFGGHGSVLGASVFSRLQTEWDLALCANRHGSQVGVHSCLHVSTSVNEEEGEEGKGSLFGLLGWKTEGLMWFNMLELNGALNLENKKKKRRRWPWLEVSRADYFMSVFKCAHTRVHVDERLGVGRL